MSKVIFAPSRVKAGVSRRRANSAWRWARTAIRAWMAPTTSARGRK